jgi:transposase InsO family protein
MPAVNTRRSRTPNGSTRSTQRRRSAASATATTTHSRRASSDCSRPNSSVGPWRNVDDVELATLGYIDWFNCRRLHSEIGDIPPGEFEAAFYRQINERELIET